MTIEIGQKYIFVQEGQPCEGDLYQVTSLGDYGCHWGINLTKNITSAMNKLDNPNWWKLYEEPKIVVSKSRLDLITS